MLMPEGNCGIAVGCGFEGDFADAGFSEAVFDGFEKARADVVAAMRLENVNRDDVAAGGLMGAQAEGDWLGALIYLNCSDEAIGAGKPEVGAKFGTGIGDVGGVAGLVNFIEGFEIGGRVGTK